VLSPTRTYAPIVKALLKTLKGNIHGLVHCSGGAQTKVLHFVNDMHIIKDNLFPVPPLFKLIHDQSGTDFKEMYKVFNMGHRLEVYLPEQYAQEVISIAAGFNVDARVIGRVESFKGKKVTIRSEYGTFEYQ
jgi:phosphoribosylformylglycinamidine cyclo-ligase